MIYRANVLTLFGEEEWNSVSMKALTMSAKGILMCSMKIVKVDRS